MTDHKLRDTSTGEMGSWGGDIMQVLSLVEQEKEPAIFFLNYYWVHVQAKILDSFFNNNLILNQQ